jgi:hypothetical protein
VPAILAKRVPNEPTFRSAQFIGNVSPLPLFMIAASGDEYVSVQATQQLFAAAREPKRLAVVTASNHKFGGATDEFFRTLKDALAWIAQLQK